MRALVSIAGHDIPDPSTYSGTTSTVVDSARNAEGVMVGGVIRDDIGKIEMTWSFITVQAWADILKRFSIKQGGSFTNSVTFFCQDTGGWETREMYVNDRKASVFLRNKDGSIKGYQNASLNLIEV
jgi:hypothetical protein